MSRPHIPDDKTREMVRDLVVLGVKQDKIADYLKISVDTLDKYYRYELDHGLYEALAPVARTAIQLAQAGNLKMIDLVLKYRAGWAKFAEDDGKKSNTDTLLEKLIDKL